MNSRSLISTVTTVSLIIDYIYAETVFIDDERTLVRLLQKEKSAGYTDSRVTSRLVDPDLYDRTKRCWKIRDKMKKVGQFTFNVHPDFHSFPIETAKGRTNIEDLKVFVDLPVALAGLDNKKMKVVRLTSTTYIREKDVNRGAIDPVSYPLGILIADSSNNPELVYVFTKHPLQDELLPVFAMIKTRKRDRSQDRTSSFRGESSTRSRGGGSTGRSR